MDTGWRGRHDQCVHWKMMVEGVPEKVQEKADELQGGGGQSLSRSGNTQGIKFESASFLSL